MFGKLRVWDTEHNNGVLIYLLLAEHAIEIVADRGLNRHVPPNALAARCVSGMSAAFKAGPLRAGPGRGDRRGGRGCCTQHFALADGAPNPNELPDAPFRR